MAVLENSPEYKTMICCTPQLVDALTNDLQTICENVYSAGLIPPHIRDLILHEKYRDHERASRLVASITDRVNCTPSDFNKFVSILKEQGEWTNHIVSHIVATFTENKLDK